MTIQPVWANNAITTLAFPISDTAVSCTLTSGSGALFPNPFSGQVFSLTFISQTNPNLFEIAWCTARSGDVCTIERGQEGTTALAWNAGDFARNYVTAGLLNLVINPTELMTWQYLATSGSIVAPPWATRIEWDQAWGGGGGGGGALGPNSSGAGGGGAEFRAGTAAVTGGETVNVVIGAGGAGGTNAPTSGTDGTATVVTHAAGGGVIVRCNPGGGGEGANAGVALVPGFGGTGGSGGQFIVSGASGGTGNNFTSPFVFSAVGGFAFCGSFGGAGISNSPVSGGPGASPGCGGSGGIIGAVGGFGAPGAFKYKWLP